MRYRLSFLEACLRHAPSAACWARERWRFDVTNRLLVIGAPMGPSEPGCVFVLARSRRATTRPVRVSPEDSARGDGFGAQLAAFEEALLVAAPNAASVYLFASDESGWRQVHRLRAPRAQADLGFGNAVDLSSELAVVGRDGPDGLPGAVAIYRRCGRGLELEQQLAIPEPRSDEAFGCAVSAFDDEIIVGSPSDTGLGSAYVYRRSRRFWKLAQTLRPPDSSGIHAFGCHLGHALGEPVVVIGATFYEGTRATPVAYLFRRGAELWHQSGEVLRNVDS